MITMHFSSGMYVFIKKIILLKLPSNMKMSWFYDHLICIMDVPTHGKSMFIERKPYISWSCITSIDTNINVTLKQYMHYRETL